ncbi:type II secretion system protein N [Arhodomonas sp. SL1]|uniref:type II secretion system protein N n=1 Tax=Arhodomonas sp. SL1 TaxID=3425691 RepID=UPI003F88247B
MRRLFRGLAWGLLFLTAFALAAVLLAPVGVAWSLLEGRVPADVHEPQGSLWNGGAGAVRVNGQLIRDVGWRVDAGALLRARLALDLRGRPGDDGTLDGHIAMGPGGRLRLEDVRADMDVDTLLGWLRRGALAPVANGRVEANLRHLAMEGERLVSAEGLLSWRGASLYLGAERPLGDIHLRLRPRDGDGVDGELTARNGPLTLDGTLTVEGDGAFRLQARIQPDPEHPGDGEAVGRSLGLANPGGTTVVEASGNLDGSGLRASQRAGD